MLRIKHPQIKDLAGLRLALQNAIELEHATIPPYLTALYSLRPGSNDEIAALIQGVVIEEMLHMTIAANVLNAIGGEPVVNKSDFVPKYPGPLPMGIGSEEHLIVPLKAFSIDLVHEIFMEIEEPEHPIDFPTRALAADDEEPHYETIGEFYTAVIATIEKLGPSIFTGDPARQVTGWFSEQELFLVNSPETAAAALNLIIEQGEGTAQDPLDPEGEMAHYYKFAEIYHGKRLVPDPSAEHGYSYSGDPIPFDADGVYPMIDNPKTDQLPDGTKARLLSGQFNQIYGKLLNCLHDTFNGEPTGIDACIGLMYSLKLHAQQLMQTEIPGTDHTAGPAWEFPGNGG